MDTERIDRLGTRPIKPLVDAVAALRDVRDMAAFLGEFERLGGHGLFGSYVNTDDRNSDRYLFHLVQGGLGLPDESYYRDEKFAAIREAYVAYLTTVLRLIDAAEDPEAGARTVLDIDTKLAGGHWERAETRDVQKTYNLRTVAELRELCPAFDWDVYVTNLSASAHEADELLAETCVRQPSYFEHLSTVLGEVPIEDWRTWLLTRVLRSSAPYLTDDFVEANFDFYGRTLNGTPELRARWKRGVSLVEGAIGEAVGKEYVARHFPPSSKQQMDELVANLLAAYRESIGQLDWMTEETKARAYEKLDTFRPKIGYPEKFRDYSALRIRPDDLLGNVAARRGVRDRPPARQDRVPGRPRRVVHAAADRQRLLQPRHQRDLLPGRDPAEAVLQPRRRSRPRTTAASAPSSATRSATASTTRARSTTAPATSTTGGRPTTSRRSR